jgi:hypothetical protein
MMDFAMAINSTALQPRMLDQIQQSLVVRGQIAAQTTRCNNHWDGLQASGKPFEWNRGGTSLFASSPALRGFFMPKKEPAEAPSPLTE